ncbi:hypothetical protein [Ferrovibrio sp.]|uniref:hypothetical protein n=1 Tax=Ferrovibrio sp. TaxID=1917215 RepID=UPI00311ECD35
MKPAFGSSEKRFSGAFHTGSGLTGRHLGGGLRYTGGNHIAGDTPILVEKPLRGSASLSINGLINCVGVVVKVRDAGRGGFSAVAGGHFTTPSMANFVTRATTTTRMIRGVPTPITRHIPVSASLTRSGQQFVSALETLIQSFQTQQLNLRCHIAQSWGGVPSTSEQEANVAAGAIIRALGLTGSIQKGASNIIVSI